MRKNWVKRNRAKPQKLCSFHCIQLKIALSWWLILFQHISVDIYNQFGVADWPNTHRNRLIAIASLNYVHTCSSARVSHPFAEQSGVFAASSQQTLPITASWKHFSATLSRHNAHTHISKSAISLIPNEITTRPMSVLSHSYLARASAIIWRRQIRAATLNGQMLKCRHPRHLR